MKKNTLIILGIAGIGLVFIFYNLYIIHFEVAIVVPNNPVAIVVPNNPLAIEVLNNPVGIERLDIEMGTISEPGVEPIPQSQLQVLSNRLSSNF